MCFFAVPFTICFTTHFILCLLEYKDSGLSDLFKKYIKSLLAWFLITVFAFNYDSFKTLAEVLYNLPEKLMQSIDPNGSKNVFSTVYSNMSDLSEKIWAKITGNSVWQITETIMLGINAGILFWIVNILIAIIYTFYAISKVLLSLIILIGPLFIGFLLFPKTRQWGMNWIGAVANQIILIYLYVLVTILQISYVESRVNNLIKGSNNSIGGQIMDGIINSGSLISLTGEILFLLPFFIFILNKLPVISASFFGATSTEGLISGGIKTLSPLRNIPFKKIGQGTNFIINNMKKLFKRK